MARRLDEAQKKNELIQIEKENLMLEKENLIHDNEELRSQILKYENTPTTSAYNDAYDKYSTLHDSFRAKFYGTICLLVCTLILSVYYQADIIKHLSVSNFENSTVEFWILKLSVMALGLTLMSYFLKQSSHYQR